MSGAERTERAAAAKRLGSGCAARRFDGGRWKPRKVSRSSGGGGSGSGDVCAPADGRIFAAAMTTTTTAAVKEAAVARRVDVVVCRIRTTTYAGIEGARRGGVRDARDETGLAIRDATRRPYRSPSSLCRSRTKATSRRQLRAANYSAFFLSANIVCAY